MVTDLYKAAEFVAECRRNKQPTVSIQSEHYFIIIIVTLLRVMTSLFTRFFSLFYANFRTQSVSGPALVSKWTLYKNEYAIVNTS